jgi:hypothetical protein
MLPFKGAAGRSVLKYTQWGFSAELGTTLIIYSHSLNNIYLFIRISLYARILMGYVARKKGKTKETSWRPLLSTTT